MAALAFPLWLISTLACSKPSGADSHATSAAPTSVAHAASASGVAAEREPVGSARPTGDAEGAARAVRGATAGSTVLEREFKDVTGKHRIVLTREPMPRGARLYAYDFCENPRSPGAPCWTIQDGIDDCEDDLAVEFVGEKLYVREAESKAAAVAVLYRMRCSSDLGPYEMKLVGYEGATKFAVRGTTGLESKLDTWPPKRVVDVRDPELARWAAATWDKHGTERF
jgi:hypothetical protein